MMSTIWLETCRGIWKDIINKCIRLETRNQIKACCKCLLWWKLNSNDFYQLDVPTCLNQTLCNPFPNILFQQYLLLQTERVVHFSPIPVHIVFISHYISTDGKSKTSEFLSTEISITAENLEVSANLPGVNQNWSHETENTARSVSKFRVISLSHFD